MTRLGIIGLGAMGGSMARAVVASGTPLVVFDVVAEAVEALVAEGAEAAGSPGDLAERVDVVSVVVVDDDQVRSVVHPGPEVVWAVHSTVLPSTVQALADHVDVIDAPVTGGASGALAGDLAVMVGGDPDLVARARPAFEPFASLVEHVGPLGAGLRAKVARNLVTYAEMVAAREVRELVQASHIDLDAFRRIVAHSDRNIPTHGGLLLDGGEGFSVMDATIPHKDLRAAIAVGAELGLPMPVAHLADELIEDVFTG